jgi:hypothetical protein
MAEMPRTAAANIALRIYIIPSILVRLFAGALRGQPVCLLTMMLTTSPSQSVAATPGPGDVHLPA